MTLDAIRENDSAAATLVQRLIEFDASLNPAERALFRARVDATLNEDDDVEGHAMQMQWHNEAGRIYRTWVEIAADAPEAKLDPNRWNTLNAASRSEPVRRTETQPALQDVN